MKSCNGLLDKYVSFLQALLVLSGFAIIFPFITRRCCAVERYLSTDCSNYLGNIANLFLEKEVTSAPYISNVVAQRGCLKFCVWPLSWLISSLKEPEHPKEYLSLSSFNIRSRDLKLRVNISPCEFSNEALALFDHPFNAGTVNGNVSVKAGQREFRRFFPKGKHQNLKSKQLFAAPPRVNELNPGADSSPLHNKKAEFIRKLREATGSGMQDCLQALQKNNYDYHKALREIISCNENLQGNNQFTTKISSSPNVASGSEKYHEVLENGGIALWKDNNRAVMVELKCKTDFVMKNSQFQDLLNLIGYELLKQKSYDNKSVAHFLKHCRLSENDQLLSEKFDLVTRKLGEPLVIQKKYAVETDPKFSSIGTYLHGCVTPTTGLVGTIVSIQFEDSSFCKDGNIKDELGNFANKLAMHITAAQPAVVHVEDMESGFLEKKKLEIIEEQRIIGKVKDEIIIRKVADGKIQKIIENSVLYEQEWMLDDSKMKVREVIEEFSKEIGFFVKVSSMRLFSTP